MKLHGVLHHPDGIEEWEYDKRGGWSRCPGVFTGKRWTARHDFDILNRLERGEIPEVTACPVCIPDPSRLAHDVILVTPMEGGADGD